MLELLAMAVDTSYRIPEKSVGFEITYQFYPAWENFPYSAWIEIDKIASGYPEAIFPVPWKQIN